MELTIHFCILLKFLMIFNLLIGVASVSTLMENFIGGVCMTTSTDIRKWGKSYVECLDECRSRSDCTAVNVYSQGNYCYLNMASGTETSCPSYVLSKKSRWNQQDVPECYGVTCLASQACVIDSSGSPECQFKECPPIEALENGVVMGNLRTVSERLVYACNNGYTLVGNVARYCTNLGDWNGTLPTCQQDATPSPGDTVDSAEAVDGTSQSQDTVDSSEGVGDTSQSQD